MMSMELFRMMIPMIGTLILLVAFLSFLLIKVPRTYMLKFLGIPLFLFYAYFSYNFYGDMLGRAVPLSLPDKFVLQGYKTHGEKTIEIWLSVGGKSRLVLVPYSVDVVRKLETGMKRYQQTGIPQEAKVKRRSKNAGSGDFDIETYDFPFQLEMPKQPPGTQYKQ